MYKNIFSKYPDIQAVYLFGSVASGKSHRESDIDLAIVPRGGNLREKKLSILTDLARCGICNVDLVFLDTDDIVLRYEAVRQNRLIYHTEDFDRGAIYSIAVRRYLDFDHYLKRHRQSQKRRMCHDTT